MIGFRRELLIESTHEHKKQLEAKIEYIENMIAKNITKLKPWLPSWPFDYYKIYK